MLFTLNWIKFDFIMFFCALPLAKQVWQENSCEAVKKLMSLLNFTAMELELDLLASPPHAVTMETVTRVASRHSPSLRNSNEAASTPFVSDYMDITPPASFVLTDDASIEEPFANTSK